MVLVVIFLVFLNLFFFAFMGVAVCDLVQDVEAINAYVKC